MIGMRFVPLVLRTTLRQRTRSALTICGVAMAMLIFGGVSTLQRGVAAATEASRDQTRLIVYRQNRFCPFTSRLPERYEQAIAEVPGVITVVPTRIVVNNCRAGLDVVTFRGVPRDELAAMARSSRLLAGDPDAVLARSDAALVGAELAARRRLKPGDRFDAAGVTTTVAAILDSREPQERSAAFVDLAFLQRAASAGGGVGVVTQFTVTVDDPDRLDAIAAAIDQRLASEPDPTTTRAETAFVAHAARDIVGIVGMTRWLGYACVAAVLALVANALVLAVQDRVRDHAIMQTLGFRRGAIARLVVAEGVLLSVAGGVLGAMLLLALLLWHPLTFSTEGVSIRVAADPITLLLGVVVAAAIGVLAGLVPAWQASRRSIAEGFRAI